MQGSEDRNESESRNAPNRTAAIAAGATFIPLHGIYAP